jgi:hypothetical protein
MSFEIRAWQILDMGDLGLNVKCIEDWRLRIGAEDLSW